MCPSLNGLSLAEEKQGCCNVSTLKSCIYVSYRTGLHKWETKIFHTPGKVSKGWLLCLPLRTHQVLQTNTHVCSRPFVGVRNCGSRVIQAQDFSRYTWKTLRKLALLLYFWNEIYLLKFTFLFFCVKVDVLRHTSFQEGILTPLVWNGTIVVFIICNCIFGLGSGIKMLKSSIAYFMLANF